MLRGRERVVKLPFFYTVNGYADYRWLVRLAMTGYDWLRETAMRKWNYLAPIQLTPVPVVGSVVNQT